MDDHHLDPSRREGVAKPGQLADGLATEDSAEVPEEDQQDGVVVRRRVEPATIVERNVQVHAHPLHPGERRRTSLSDTSRFMRIHSIRVSEGDKIDTVGPAGKAVRGRAAPERASCCFRMNSRLVM
jgi:hypothetical protein